MTTSPYVDDLIGYRLDLEPAGRPARTVADDYDPLPLSAVGVQVDRVVSEMRGVREELDAAAE